MFELNKDEQAGCLRDVNNHNNNYSLRIPYIYNTIYIYIHKYTLVCPKMREINEEKIYIQMIELKSRRREGTKIQQ